VGFDNRGKQHRRQENRITKADALVLLIWRRGGGGERGGEEERINMLIKITI